MNEKLPKMVCNFLSSLNTHFTSKIFRSISISLLLAGAPSVLLANPNDAAGPAADKALDDPLSLLKNYAALLEKSDPFEVTPFDLPLDAELEDFQTAFLNRLQWVTENFNKIPEGPAKSEAQAIVAKILSLINPVMVEIKDKPTLLGARQKRIRDFVSHIGPIYWSEYIRQRGEITPSLVQDPLSHSRAAKLAEFKLLVTLASEDPQVPGSFWTQREALWVQIREQFFHFDPLARALEAAMNTSLLSNGEKHPTPNRVLSDLLHGLVVYRSPQHPPGLDGSWVESLGFDRYAQFARNQVDVSLLEIYRDLIRQSAGGEIWFKTTLDLVRSLMRRSVFLYPSYSGLLKFLELLRESGLTRAQWVSVTREVLLGLSYGSRNFHQDTLDSSVIAALVRIVKNEDPNLPFRFFDEVTNLTEQLQLRKKRHSEELIDLSLLMAVYREIPWSHSQPKYNQFEAADRLRFLEQTLEIQRHVLGQHPGAKDFDFPDLREPKEMPEGLRAQWATFYAIKHEIDVLKHDYPAAIQGTCGVWARWILGRLPN